MMACREQVETLLSERRGNPSPPGKIWHPVYINFYCTLKIAEKTVNVKIHDFHTNHFLASDDLDVSAYGLDLLLNVRIAFCPINENERKLLDTIPLLSDYENSENQVNGKNFLQKVKELHNIDVNTFLLLTVSLKKKMYITIGGGKMTCIILLDKCVKYLREVSYKV